MNPNLHLQTTTATTHVQITTRKTWRISEEAVKDLVLAALGLTDQPGVEVAFDADGYGLDGVDVTQTIVETKGEE